MSVKFVRFTLSINKVTKLIRKLRMDGMNQFNLKGESTQILYQLYEHEQGMSFKDLVQECGLDPAMISRNLKKLVENQIVYKTGEDGRYKATYYLSDKGWQVMRKVDAIINQVEKEALKGISESEMDLFYKILSKLMYNLENLPGDWSDYESKNPE